jgi:hypothetical protein
MFPLGHVSVADLVRIVALALGKGRTSDEMTCLVRADGDVDGVLQVSELVRSVDFSLEGCPPPSPTVEACFPVPDCFTPIPTATPSPAVE